MSVLRFIRSSRDWTNSTQTAVLYKKITMVSFIFWLTSNRCNCWRQMVFRKDWDLCMIWFQSSILAALLWCWVTLGKRGSASCLICGWFRCCLELCLFGVSWRRSLHRWYRAYQRFLSNGCNFQSACSGHSVIPVIVDCHASVRFHQSYRITAYPLVQSKWFEIPRKKK